VLLWLLTGCTPEPPAPLRLGTNVWPGYEPLYLARELGHLPDPPIRLVEYGSATQVIAAFRNGVIDAAALTLDEVLLLAQDGHRPCIVAVLDFSAGADAIVARPGVKTLAELRGRRIGVENGALGAYLLTRALQHGGVPRTAVEVLPLTVDEHERAYREGRVDALVTFEPARRRLLALGARVLFDSRRLPGEIMDVLVVRRDYLDAHPQQARLLVDGWLRALATLRADPRAAAQRMAPRTGLTPQELLDGLAGLRLPDLAENHRLLAGPAPAARAAGERLVQVMLEQRLLHNPVEIERLLDPRLLPPPNR
jgi:NitT/TauT family transport system substrate-binding protein